jgi:IPT/TIG domain.
MTDTITRLARDWKLDVSTDNINWVPLVGMNDFSDTVTPNLVDSSDYDTDGWGSSEPTFQDWKTVIKLNRKATAGVSDPGQEILRACRGQFGDAARAYLRWYKRADGSEAQSGRAIIEWAPSKTSNKDLEEIQVTATGDGVLSSISNVDVTPPVPTITSVTPSGAAAAAQITIYGSAFTTTVASTGVKVGGVAAVPFTVVSDSVIVATMPTGATGATTVVVTNSTGASAGFGYTRS